MVVAHCGECGDGDEAAISWAEIGPTPQVVEDDFVRELHDLRCDSAQCSAQRQMFYGLRRGRWEELVGAGYNVRIHVPFGTLWIPCFYRRLRERQETIAFVLRNLFRWAGRDATGGGPGERWAPGSRGGAAPRELVRPTTPSGADSKPHQTAPPWPSGTRA